MASTPRTCNHVLSSGNTCDAVALRDEDYCYFHTMTRHRLRRMRQAERDRKPLQFGILEDDGDVQLALGDLANAVLRGSLEPKRGWLILQILQTAARNSTGAFCFDDANDHFQEFEEEQLDDGSQPDSDEIEDAPKLPAHSVSLPAEADAAS
jgi:hypothetical protein